MSYTVEHRGNVSIVTIRYNKAFQQDFLLSADRHWDNPKSLHGMQKKHLDEAVARRAGWLDFGDLFCAMQGKYDPRSSKTGLRPEHQRNDYLDALVDTSTDFFKPYAQRAIRIARGNHETSILKRQETDLIARLVENLNRQRNTNIAAGGYSGWIMFRFVDQTGTITTKKLWYIHGYGGGGPVTKGVIQSNRQAVYVPDADFVVNGHIHEEWVLPITRTRLGDDGTQYLDEQLHVRVPTYKDEYGDGSGGWHVERGGPPKPLGAAWLTFRKRANSKDIESSITRAK